MGPQYSRGCILPNYVYGQHFCVDTHHHQMVYFFVTLNCLVLGWVYAYVVVFDPILLSPRSFYSKEDTRYTLVSCRVGFNMAFVVQ